ncbi:MAG: AAA family ATPase, partial [Acidimicrobiaceae bacterium]|nr:AAA family ATPase [Acidimicrobiaceae bacterium]
LAQPRARGPVLTGSAPTGGTGVSEQRHADELAWEQSVNERYLREFEARAGKAGRVWDTVAGPANTGFADSGPKKPRPRRRPEPLVGRVAFTVDVEELGRSFYVGDGFTLLDASATDDDTTVVSWAAGVARLFFEGREAQLHSAEGIDPHGVAARRSFKSHGHQLVDFEDDCEPGVDPSSAFEHPSPRAIPLPPDGSASTGPLPRKASSKADQIRPSGDRATDRKHVPRGDGQVPDDPHGDGEAPREPPGRDPSAEHPHVPASTTGDPPAPTEASEPTDSQPHIGPSTADDAPTAAEATDLADPQSHMSHGGAGGAPSGASVPQLPADRNPEDRGDRMSRAGRLLNEAINAPKTGSLAPVLSTLQPEQYRLVTWPSDENLSVQGHPGTGKTILAAHRAVYLVLPKDREDQAPRLHKVALVGPTDRWLGHIQPTVAGLADEGVDVLSLESLVRDWAGGLPRALHPTSERELHSRWAIGRIVDRAASAQKSRLSQYKPAARVRELVNGLVQDTEAHRKFARLESTDLSTWLLEAGSYQQARRDSSYLLFLAAAGLAASGAGKHSGHQHIVVDEAQDIRPVEWWMLSRMFRAGAEERWSLLGDMNQRRSDSAWESWETLTDRLELSSTDGQPLVPEVLGSGYRSTREILDYAAALLPRGMRKHHALRSGPEPSIRRAGPHQLEGKTVEAAVRLTIRYHQGSVAVIAWDQGKVKQIERTLLKQGWRRDTGGGRWLQPPHRVCRLGIIGPAEARGLEFDAVVVVEPADFKPNLGRHGELYTSLTRANQELVVIHSKAMPKELAGRGNRVRG